MSNKSLKTRIEALEKARWARMTPLERAYALIAKDIYPEQWPDDFLIACGEMLPPELRALSNEELQEMLDAPPSEQGALYTRLTGRTERMPCEQD